MSSYFLGKGLRSASESCSISLGVSVSPQAIGEEIRRNREGALISSINNR